MADKMLLTMTEAAKLLGVGSQAVREAVDAGQIRTVTLARRRLIPRAALEELVKGDGDGQARAW